MLAPAIKHRHTTVAHCRQVFSRGEQQACTEGGVSEVPKGLMHSKLVPNLRDEWQWPWPCCESGVLGVEAEAESSIWPGRPKACGKRHCASTFYCAPSALPSHCRSNERGSRVRGGPRCHGGQMRCLQDALPSPGCTRCAPCAACIHRYDIMRWCSAFALSALVSIGMPLTAMPALTKPRALVARSPRFPRQPCRPGREEGNDDVGVPAGRAR